MEKPFGRPWVTREDNIKMYLKNATYENAGRINIAQYRLSW